MKQQLSCLSDELTFMSVGALEVEFSTDTLANPMSGV
jgi:hypothetical protein